MRYRPLVLPLLALLAAAACLVGAIMAHYGPTATLMREVINGRLTGSFGVIALGPTLIEAWWSFAGLVFAILAAWLIRRVLTTANPNVLVPPPEQTVATSP